MGKIAEWAEVPEYYPKDYSLDITELLDRIRSLKFHDLMDARMLVSHYKYGNSEDAYPEKSKAIDNIKVRVDKYVETGNVEFLVDAANFCMLEFMHPAQENAFFKATDSNESPGILYQDGEFGHSKHENKT